MTENRYKMISTSSISSKIEDIELDQSTGGLTRRVLRAEVIENPHDKNKSLSIGIVHQRRANTTVSWEDLGGTQLSELKGGEASKITFNTTQTKTLYDHLTNLYKVGSGGVRSGVTVLEIVDEDQVIRTDSGRARIIKKLLEGNHEQQIWDSLVQDDPNLATKMSLARIYTERQRIIREFEENIGKNMDEAYWQKLLESNSWIFGPSYIGLVGERRVNIKSQLDHPLISEDGYLEIIEIKKPSFEFWEKKTDGTLNLYRGKYPVINTELRNALSQATNYVFEAEKEIDSIAWKKEHNNIPPLKPKCLVVHGRSSEWSEDENVAFRLLNDSLHGVSCITFDHLLSRAKQSLELVNPKRT